MAADPFVAPTLDDAPRQEHNLAPGVAMPAAHRWVANRPGDEVSLGQPQGRLFGTPGPNIGFALTLARLLEPRVTLAPGEFPRDAMAVVSELAMKRAAAYGRAPVLVDLEAAATLLGYVGGCDADDAVWRARVVDGAEHDYPTRRALCDAVDLDALRRSLPDMREQAPTLRAQLRAAWRPGAI